MSRVLHQLPRSPFSRKARWLLRFKRCEASIVDVANRAEIERISGQTDLPVLVVDDRIVAGAKAIALHLEREVPEPSFFPLDPRRRNQAVTLDAFADAAFGRPLVALFPDRVALAADPKEGTAASLGGAFADLREALERTREGIRRGALDTDGVHLGDIAVAAQLVSVREIPALRFARDYPDLDLYVERVRTACGAGE